MFSSKIPLSIRQFRQSFPSAHATPQTTRNPPLPAPPADLVSTKPFKLWLELSAKSSSVHGEKKLEEQLRSMVLSPINRLCRVEQKTYNQVLSALLTPHVMLQVTNTRALSTVYRLVEKSPHLQTQAHELKKLLDAEYGLIGITGEHEYPHPRQLIDAYTSMNKGNPVPVLSQPIIRFFKRATLPPGQEMVYLGILAGIEKNANTLLHTQAAFINGLIYGLSPYQHRPYANGLSTLPGQGIVQTFFHAHYPFEGDEQSKLLTAEQKEHGAASLGATLIMLESLLRAQGPVSQISHVTELKENILTPDKRAGTQKPHSTDPTAADANHVDLVNSLVKHFTSTNPTLRRLMHAAWQNTVTSYYEEVTPILANALLVLREGERALGLHEAYRKLVADADNFLNAEEKAINDLLHETCSMPIKHHVEYQDFV